MVKKFCVALGIIACAVLPHGCAPPQGSKGADREAKVESLKAMGDAHLREGRFRAAMQHYREAEALAPDDSELKFRIALVYGDYFKRLNEAEQYYLEAIKLKKDYSEAYNNLGTIYLRQKRLDEAITMFHKALENIYYSTPEFAYYNLGRANEEKGDDDKAIEYYEMAIELKKPYLDPYGRLGALYQRKGRYGEALRVFQQLAAQLEKKDLRKGKATEDELKEYKASLAGSYYHQAMCLKSLGKLDEAQENLQRALELAPDPQMQKSIRRAMDSLGAP